MFDNLSEKLGGILDRLTRRGALTEADVDAAMREVRRALLEADVALDVVRSFTDKVREQAIGATVVKSVTPGQMVVKIVHDELVATLGADGHEAIDLNAVPPVAIMMVLGHARASQFEGACAVLSRQRAVVLQRQRVFGENPQPHLAAHAMRSPDPRHADALALALWQREAARSEVGRSGLRR